MANTNEIEGQDTSAATEIDPIEGEAGEGEAGSDEGKEGDGKGDEGRKAETPEARKSRLTRELNQLRKKNPDLFKDEDKPEPKKSAGKKSELDFGQMAYLNSLEIKADDEQALALQIMDETGKSLKDVVSSNYFKAELKALREETAAADAIPTGKRNGASSPSSVEYWIAKGGLPANTPENQKLRQDIVKARQSRAGAGSPFTSNPVG